MGWSVEQLDGGFGAVVHGVHLRRLDDEAAARLIELWVEHALLILPGQHLTPDEQDTVARRFGDLEFRAAPITNLAEDGTVLTDLGHDTVKSIRGNEGWHHDSTYMPVQARGAVVTAEVVPTEGGATGFADMRAAYDALDDADRQLVHTHTAAHSLEYSQGRAGYLPTRQPDGTYAMYGYHGKEAPRRPMVKVHPDTGHPNLLIGRHAHAVDGLDPAASEALVDRLNEAACDAAPTYHHRWTVGDALIWDNRRLMHQATPFDLREPRRIWHTRIAGDPATESALNHPVATTG